MTLNLESICTKKIFTRPNKIIFKIIWLLFTGTNVCHRLGFGRESDFIFDIFFLNYYYHY